MYDGGGTDSSQAQTAQHQSNAGMAHARGDRANGAQGPAGRAPLFGKLFDKLSEAVGATRELLADGDLRRRAMPFVLSEGGKALQELQKGLSRNAAALGRHFQQNSGSSHFAAFIPRLLERAAAQQPHGRVLRHDLPISLWVGRRIIGDLPQEARSRFWYCLLQDPVLQRSLGPVCSRALLRGEGGEGMESAPAATALHRDSLPLLPGLDNDSDDGGAGGDDSVPSAAAGARSANSMAAAGPLQVSVDPATVAAAAAVDTLLLAQLSPSLHQPPPDEATPGDGWEVLDGGEGSSPDGGAVSLTTGVVIERLQALLEESRSAGANPSPQLAALWTAMLAAPWEPGRGGLVCHVEPDCRYLMLNEMTAGQEEVDDVIMRDIHRTFPEHPLFAATHGQMALFRLLKAYSLHDLEGMAFTAGVMLMYLPEEAAFRLYCQVMGDEGPNLRRLYLPGLQPLQDELARFEALLAITQPEVQARLQAFCIPPVLYASQWIMTVFASPFPPSFCAQLLDIMAQDGHDAVIMRVSLTIMDLLAPSLLELHDFEALLTTIKLEPLRWDDVQLEQLLLRAVTCSWDIDLDLDWHIAQMVQDLKLKLR